MDDLHPKILHHKPNSGIFLSIQGHSCESFVSKSFPKRMHMQLNFSNTDPTTAHFMDKIALAILLVIEEIITLFLINIVSSDSLASITLGQSMADQLDLDF
jgi:hypothetical protein